MKFPSKYLFSSVALLAIAPFASAEKEVVLRRLDTEPSPQVVHRDREPVEKEPVAFLGVETAPVGRALSTQLGLTRGTGLIVVHVVDQSPAAGVLKEDDVLTKLDDQVLVNMPQLGVLVRAHKEGDSVKLTLIRGGKETTVAAKLSVHDVPKFASAFSFGGGGDLLGNEFFGGEGGGDLRRLRELPDMGPDGARDVLRMIQHERANSLTGPGIHIIGRGGRESTIVDLPKSNISYSDDDGSIEIKVDEGKRNLTVKNAKGEVAFAGPINTEEERRKLPPAVNQRLQILETDTMNVEVDGDFRPEVVPLPPEPAKTKISFPPRNEASGKSRAF